MYNFESELYNNQNYDQFIEQMNMNQFKVQSEEQSRTNLYQQDHQQQKINTTIQGDNEIILSQLEVKQSHEQLTTKQPLNQLKTLLATAVIPICTPNGDRILLRAILDQGSTANLITQQAAERIGATLIPTNIPLMGIGNTRTGNALSNIELIIS